MNTVSFYTEREKFISFDDASLSVNLLPQQRNTYVPVVRLPGEDIWRKICIPLNEQIQHIEDLQQHPMCRELYNQPTEFDVDNVSSSNIWLARVKDVAGLFHQLYLDNLVEGNCSQFGRNLLMLRCFSIGMPGSRDFYTLCTRENRNSI